MKLSTAIKRFDTQLRADGKSERTRQAYLRDLADLRSWLGADVNIASITPDKLARFLADGNGHRAALSVNRTKTALRVFCRFLTDARYVSENLGRLIHSTPTDRRVPGYLTVDEARSLLTTMAEADSPIAQRDHAMFSLLLGTGIRLGSLVALNAGDVNLGERMIAITAKGGRDDTVFLNRELALVLRRYIATLDAADDSPLFCSREGGRLGPRQVQLRLKHWIKAAGIAKPVSVHCLRHSFATRLYSLSGDLHLVQRALGHKQISTTEIYARVEDKALRKALDSLRF